VVDSGFHRRQKGQDHIHGNLIDDCASEEVRAISPGGVLHLSAEREELVFRTYRGSFIPDILETVIGAPRRFLRSFLYRVRVISANTRTQAQVGDEEGHIAARAKGRGVSRAPSRSGVVK
jgi:hypothetical protein